MNGDEGDWGIVIDLRIKTGKPGASHHIGFSDTEYCGVRSQLCRNSK